MCLFEDIEKDFQITIVCRNNKFGVCLYNENNEEQTLIPPIFDYIMPLDENSCFYVTVKNGKQGLYMIRGSYEVDDAVKIADCEHDIIFPSLSSNEYCFVKDDFGIRFVTKYNKKLSEPFVSITELEYPYLILEEKERKMIYDSAEEEYLFEMSKNAVCRYLGDYQSGRVFAERAYFQEENEYFTLDQLVFISYNKTVKRSAKGTEIDVIMRSDIFRNHIVGVTAKWENINGILSKYDVNEMTDNKEMRNFYD